MNNTNVTNLQFLPADGPGQGGLAGGDQVVDGEGDEDAVVADHGAGADHLGEPDTTSRRHHVPHLHQHNMGYQGASRGRAYLDIARA